MWWKQNKRIYRERLKVTWQKCLQWKNNKPKKKKKKSKEKKKTQAVFQFSSVFSFQTVSVNREKSIWYKTCMNAMWCCIKYVNSPNVLYYHSGWTEYTKRDNTKIYSVDLRTAKLGCAVLPLHLIHHQEFVLLLHSILLCSQMLLLIFHFLFLRPISYMLIVLDPLHH